MWSSESRELAWFRLAGLLPLGFFLAHLAQHWSAGKPGNSLWMCHVSNAALAAGMLLYQPVLVRLAVIWIIPGIPLWIYEMVLTGEAPPTTFVSHLGGLAVGLWAMRRARAARRTWWIAILWYLAVQQVCRWTTPPELNVNLAHRMRPGWERILPGYLWYWILTTLSMALVLWLIGKALLRLYPPHATRGGRSESGPRGGP